jgi:hypothetical protein
MTKFYVTVCLPPQSGGDVDGAVREILRPYDMNLGESDNPVGEWDWYAIRGDLPVRPECEGDPLLVHNPVHPSGEVRPRRPLRCDGGPRRMLDFPALREAAAARARARWQAWHALTTRYPHAESLSDLLARHSDPAEARRAHLAQPLVQEVAQRAARGDQHFPTQFLLVDPVEHFDDVQQDYVDQATQDADFTFALITTDGRWFDEFTISGSERDLPAYRRFRATYLDNLDDDAFIISVLCHC